MTGKLSKLSKVSESFTVYRYDNGFMIEVSGRDEENDWKTVKLLCNTEAELLEVIKEANSMTLDN
jgi:hypothetical protein